MMYPVGGVSAPAIQGAANEGDWSVAVAAKALDQTKRDGQNAAALVATAAPPPTGDHRGRIVNTMA